MSPPTFRQCTLRKVRRAYSMELKDRDGAFVLALAKHIVTRGEHRWVAYELLRYHPASFTSLDAETVEELGVGICSWDTVDSFARIISGPAWLKGLIGDDVIERWARSEDRCWRRAALVSTVAWNMRSQAGPGDLPRTFRIAEMLIDDRDDMVVKAMSWALREIVSYDAGAVETFLARHEDRLAARVKREVRNKLRGSRTRSR